MSYSLMTKSLTVDTISKNRIESDHFGIRVNCSKELTTEPPYRFNNYILKNHKYRGELYQHIKNFFLKKAGLQELKQNESVDEVILDKMGEPNISFTLLYELLDMIIKPYDISICILNRCKNKQRLNSLLAVQKQLASRNHRDLSGKQRAKLKSISQRIEVLKHEDSKPNFFKYIKNKVEHEESQNSNFYNMFKEKVGRENIIRQIDIDGAPCNPM